jgi:Flp pilus assembly protein protease CpaA
MYAQLLWLLLLGIPIAIIDVRSHRIPNNLLALFLVGSEALRLIFDRKHFLLSLQVGAAALVFSAALYLLSRGRIGMGDLKLIVVLGLLLGDFARGLFAWFIALIFGLFLALCYRKRSIPFAPALLLAALLTI